MVKVLKPIISNPRLSVMDIQRDSPCAAALFAWVKKVVLQHLQRVGERLQDPQSAFVHSLHDSQHPQEGMWASSNGRGGAGARKRGREQQLSVSSSPSLPSSNVAARAQHASSGAFQSFLASGAM